MEASLPRGPERWEDWGAEDIEATEEAKRWKDKEEENIKAGRGGNFKKQLSGGGKLRGLWSGEVWKGRLYGGKFL